MSEGVSFYPRTGKYRARVQRTGRDRHLGYFDTPAEAMAAVEAISKIAPKTYDLTKRQNIDRVRTYLQQNLGCSKKEVAHATGLHPRTIARAIRIIRGQLA